MGGYYPDGVSGNEYEIAGPEREWDEDRDEVCTNEDCASFDQEAVVSVTVTTHGSQGWTQWSCPTCGSSTETEFSVDGPEYEREDYEDR
jgi:hypothetical protein